MAPFFLRPGGARAPSAPPGYAYVSRLGCFQCAGMPKIIYAEIIVSGGNTCEGPYTPLAQRPPIVGPRPWLVLPVNDTSLAPSFPSPSLSISLTPRARDPAVELRAALRYG